MSRVASARFPVPINSSHNANSYWIFERLITGEETRLYTIMCCVFYWWIGTKRKSTKSDIPMRKCVVVIVCKNKAHSRFEIYTSHYYSYMYVYLYRTDIILYYYIYILRVLFANSYISRLRTKYGEVYQIDGEYILNNLIRRFRMFR